VLSVDGPSVDESVSITVLACLREDALAAPLRLAARRGRGGRDLAARAARVAEDVLADGV